MLACHSSPPVAGHLIIVDTPAPATPRTTILITHANPEDNRFARWLAARLTGAGYRTWVDVRALRGGEDFWDSIEHVLRHEAVKQIVLVSQHIGKQGVKKELALGDLMGRKLGDAGFMIPIRVSDVDFGDFPTEILRLERDQCPPELGCMPCSALRNPRGRQRPTGRHCRRRLAGSHHHGTGGGP